MFQVHSLDSNVSLTSSGRILVRSTAARIDASLLRDVALSVRANASALLMDAIPQENPTIYNSDTKESKNSRKGLNDLTLSTNFALLTANGTKMDVSVAEEWLVWSSVAEEMQVCWIF